MRWTQRDPLDQTGDLREGNRYIYAGGDPVNLVDLLGTYYCTAQACFPQYEDCQGFEGSSSAPVCREKYANKDPDLVGDVCKIATLGSSVKNLRDAVKSTLKKPTVIGSLATIGCAFVS